jgi:hypothetical protein
MTARAGSLSPKLLASTLLVGATISTAAPISASSTIYQLSIAKRVVVEDSGNPNYSQVGVPITVKCDESLPSIQFNVFVSQPQAPNSFGYIVAECTGKTEQFIAHVQSSYGTLYLPGDATASMTNNRDGMSRNVIIPG